MEPTLETIQILQDLLSIHSELIAEYENAIREAIPDKVILKTIFARMILESRSMRTDLEDAVNSLGGLPGNRTIVPGKLYQAWKNERSVSPGQNYFALLNNCIHSEIAADKAYLAALHSGALPAAVYKLVREQQQTIKTSGEIARTHLSEIAN